jgi:hypothetical protein
MKCHECNWYYCSVIKKVGSRFSLMLFSQTGLYAKAILIQHKFAVQKQVNNIEAKDLFKIQDAYIAAVYLVT